MIRNAVRMVVPALALLCALPAEADSPAGRQAWYAERAGGTPAAKMAPMRVATGAAGTTASASSADAPLPRTIRDVQALLARLGYAPGPVDGIWGPRTGRAYQAFLRDAGLPASKRPTPEALREMAKRGGVEPDGPAPAVRAAPEAPRASSGADVSPTPAAASPAALHRAVETGDLAGLRAALAAGVDVDAQDGRGWTALMHAANKGYTLLVEPLLSAEADPDARAPDGATALFLAAVHGHTEIIVSLTEAGADISAPGPKGRTAVDAALVHGDRAVLRVFIDVALSYGDTAVLETLGIPREGDVFRDCAECPELVAVSSGSFMMGSPVGEAGRDGDEGPVHEVVIARPFAVGVYEVTFREWDACVSGGGCGGYRPDDEGWGRGRRPVINVGWEDAKGYVEWLSRKTGEEYRLLSESEWEYVARAGTRMRYWWGDGIGRNLASCSGCGSRWDARQTAPMGSFSPNAFGLYDVHGNVWEWVEDCWHDDYDRAPTDGTARTRSGDCGSRLLRGGSWNNDPRHLRCAVRDRKTRGLRTELIGFRVARTLIPS